PALAALLLAVVAAVAMRPWIRDPYEWDFAKLRTLDPHAQQSWERMHHVGIGAVVQGYIATDGVIIVDRPEQADPVADALLEKARRLGPDKNMIRKVRTLNSVLPTDQAAKLELLDRLRAKLDRRRSLMSEDEAREAAAWRPPDYLRQLTAQDLP